jgi:hypothetical protein
MAGLFPGVKRLEVDLALFAWGVLNGTGSNTDYTNAPPITAGGISVPATRVFGEILPLDSRGVPRKVFSTYFEGDSVRYLDAFPEFVPMLAARAAKAGQPGSPPILHVDFVRGVTASTMGNSLSRLAGKDNLLARRGKGAHVETRGGQVTPVVEMGNSSANAVSGGLY